MTVFHKQHVFSPDGRPGQLTADLQTVSRDNPPPHLPNPTQLAPPSSELELGAKKHKLSLPAGLSSRLEVIAQFAGHQRKVEANKNKLP